ncbi:MAG: FkbM family methyltransferase [Patescibacteria group bacterium]|nr:FkbM family methyltransferase [Patescibacteria group bacterium]
MKYEYVDIGTSDFGTSMDVAKDDDKVILVEPLIYYLSKLPCKSNIYKCPFALTDGENGVKSIYYVPESVIIKNGYPLWAKGCNRLNEPHPTLLKIGIPESDFSIANVPCISVNTFISMYDISEIGRLKIDTEGNEDKLLEVFFSFQFFNMIKIKEIIFEYIWIEKESLNNIIKKYKKYFNVNYEKDGDDIKLILGERK